MPGTRMFPKSPNYFSISQNGGSKDGRSVPKTSLSENGLHSSGKSLSIFAYLFSYCLKLSLKCRDDANIMQ